MSADPYMTNSREPSPLVPKTVANHKTLGALHLDALRGAAALIVFVNHTRALYFSSPLPNPRAAESYPVSTTPANTSSNDLFSGTVSFAGEAVIIFFVLSGYLVGGGVLRAARSQRWSWTTYLIKRLTRLYVVLIPALLLCKLLDSIGLALAKTDSVYHTPKGIALVITSDLSQHLGMFQMLGNIFFLQGIRVPSFGTDVALWSLANEFWYYIIFPLCVIALVGAGYSRTWRLAFAVLAMLLFVFVGLKIQLLLPTWVLGALLVLIPAKLPTWARKYATLSSTLALAATMVLVRLLSLRPIAADYVLALVSSAALYCMVQHRSPAKNTVYKRVASFFSEISYSLYLFHLPVAIFICGLIDQPWRRWEWTASYIARYIVIDCLTLVIVCVLWKLFEANTDRVRRVLFEGKKGKYIGSMS